MRIIYMQHSPEEWPKAGEEHQPKSPIIRVHSAELRDGKGKGDHGEDVGQHMVITLEYGCGHKKLSNAAPWGKWWCTEMSCSHYVGKKGVRNP
jgi:hypothetical protein